MIRLTKYYSSQSSFPLTADMIVSIMKAEKNKSKKTTDEQG